MLTLGIDIESYSSTDLLKSGVYKYVQAPDFEILLFAYSVDNSPVEVVDLASSIRSQYYYENDIDKADFIPADIWYALRDPAVLKTAWNAAFERTAISRYFNLNLPVEQWQCTMAHGTMVGLPLSLDTAAKVLKIDAQKDASGKALIKYFSLPCKPTKANGGRTRNLPHHDPEKWAQFKAYCVQDVVVEQSIKEKIAFYTIPETEKKLWQLDQTINDTGILLDPPFIKNAIRIENNHREKLTTEAVKITGLENPNSASQLKNWLTKETGEEVETLRKTDIPELLKQTSCDVVKRVLELRQEMSKTSVKKYFSMVNCCCTDNRARGLFQYYGANRTGRWSGRLIQMQNLPRNEMSDLDLARKLVRADDVETLELLFDSVPDTLSQLIRTAFVAPAGYRFIVADFSAIEARVIAWLAGERWRLDVFNTHGKIYEASASQMFKVPLESVTKGSDLRQKGKVSELALGYQGGPNALITMGALRMGVCDEAVKRAKLLFDKKVSGFSDWEECKKDAEEKELAKLVAMWRQANKAVVRFWQTCENAAVEAVDTGAKVTIQHGISFFKEKGILFIQLPSGRRLSYLRPQLRPNRFGGVSLYYEGMDQTTKQWKLQQTYGGKLVENIVQATARDVLADAMLRVADAGYKIVLHVHDEIVSEMPYGKGSCEEVNAIMGTPIPWAKGLPLKADSYETEYYKKD